MQGSGDPCEQESWGGGRVQEPQICAAAYPSATGRSEYHETCDRNYYISPNEEVMGSRCSVPSAVFKNKNEKKGN